MKQNQRGDMKITKPPSNLEPDRDTHSWVWYWDADDYVWGFECRTADVDIPQLTQGHFLLREDEVGRFYRKQPADLFKALEKTDMAQAYLPNGDILIVERHDGRRAGYYTIQYIFPQRDATQLQDRIEAITRGDVSIDTPVWTSFEE
jgi:hypothetical protein